LVLKAMLIGVLELVEEPLLPATPAPKAEVSFAPLDDCAGHHAPRPVCAVRDV
jgi:hypothetical protein